MHWKYEFDTARGLESHKKSRNHVLPKNMLDTAASLVYVAFVMLRVGSHKNTRPTTDGTATARIIEKSRASILAGDCKYVAGCYWKPLRANQT